MGASADAGSGLRVTGLGVFAALWAAALPTFFLANFSPPTFVPKYALMLLAAAVGVAPLIRLTRHPQMKWAARGAVAFLAVAGLSAALSTAPNIGLFGLYEWGTGWWFWLSCAGAFAIGAQLSAVDRRWALYGLLFGAVVNAAMGIYQVVGKPSGSAFAAYPGGRADGFLGNPIHLEALLLGALALVASKACDSLRRWWWLLLLFGVSLEFTSERAAIVFLVVIFAVVVWRRRARGAVFSAIVAAGYGIGYLGGGSGLGTRVTSGTTDTTFTLRGHAWATALEATPHHLLLGGGPGQFLGATAPYVDLSFAHQLGGRLFADAHDWPVEVLATTGILGALCFACWALGVLRFARGPFLAFAAGVLGVELIEPLNVGVTPLAFLALGCSVASTGVIAGFEHRRSGAGPTRGTGRSSAAALSRRRRSSLPSGSAGRSSRATTSTPRWETSRSR